MKGPIYIDIDRREDLSRDEFIQEYLNEHRPVIMKGAARDWPAVRKWSPTWFAEKYGDLSVPIAIGPRRKIESRKPMRMRDYVKLMREMSPEDQHMYLRQFNIFKLMPELLKDLPDLKTSYGPRDRELLRNFWMGKNTVQTLHQDADISLVGTCNLFAQIFGSKRVILAAPSQTPYLYKQTGEETNYNLSQVDIEDPDFERFPLVRKATLWTGTVEAGDLMLIPLNFWHYLESYGSSISVSSWWHPHAVSALIYRILKLAYDNPQIANQYIRQNSAVVRLQDVIELGGIEQLRYGILKLPTELQAPMKQLLDGETLAAMNQIENK